MTWKWWLLIGVVAVILLGAIGIGTWYYSHADIRRVIAQANAEGLATTGAELGWQDPTPDQEARMQRVLSFTSLASFRSISGNYDKYPRLGEPPTPELRAHIQGLSQASLHELSDAVDALGEQNWVLHGHIDIDSPLSEISEQRNLVKLMGERIRLADPGALPDLTRQALRLSFLAREQNLLAGLVNRSCVANVVSDLTARLPELIGTPGGRLVANSLRSARDRLWRERAQPQSGEQVMFMASIDAIGERLSAWTDPGASPDGWEDWVKYLVRPVISRFDWRARRAEALMNIMKTTKAYLHASDVATLAASLRPAPPAASSWAGLVAWSGSTNVMSILASNELLLNSFIKTLQTLDVVIAELDQSGPALDLSAKPGIQVMPIIRDGRRIGWYSVGPNGIDDGGIPQKDFAIPISERPGRVHFSDALEPRLPPALPEPSAP